jgi:hypothetical protein
MEVGIMGRQISTPCVRIESRNRDSMAPWCRVTFATAVRCAQHCELFYLESTSNGYRAVGAVTSGARFVGCEKF